MDQEIDMAIGGPDGIGTLGESPLHASLKEHYRRPGDLVEEPVDGCIADLLRGDRLIEIQTKSFSSMQRKFDRLLDSHPILLVHPIPAVRWVVKLDDDGEVASRRRSPKRGIAADVCDELVAFPSLLDHPNFTLELAMVEEDEVRRPHATKGWRKGGYVIDHRRLIDVVETVRLSTTHDLLSLIDVARLPDPFTTADLARVLKRSRKQAQRVAYCLRVAEVVVVIDRTASGNQYRLP